MASTRVNRLKKQAQLQAESSQVIAQKAVGYVRVSTEEQATVGHGLEVQERAIRSFAESQGYELVDIVVDAGVSGAKKPEDRPGFQRVLGLAADHAFAVLLVWKFDRLARNLTYAVTTVNSLQEQHGVVLRSVTEPIDTATPMGQTIFAVLAGMATQERLAIIERTLAGKREKAKKGGFAGGAAPYGYTRDKEGGLQVVPDEAKVVRRMFALRDQGATLQQVADTLNQEGATTRRGSRWYPGTVAYVLDNPKYRGEIEYYFRWGGVAEVHQEGQQEAIVPKGR